MNNKLQQSPALPSGGAYLHAAHNVHQVWIGRRTGFITIIVMGIGRNSKCVPCAPSMNPNLNNLGSSWYPCLHFAGYETFHPFSVVWSWAWLSCDLDRDPLLLHSLLHVHVPWSNPHVSLCVSSYLSNPHVSVLQIHMSAPLKLTCKYPHVSILKILLNQPARWER